MNARSKQFLSKIKFSVVFVSPMRRCIETAYHLFKDLDCFQTTQFILVPFIREQLHTAGDVAVSYAEMVQHARAHLPNVDTDMFFEEIEDLDMW